jgi:putative FmdB family regulatory protein
MPLASFLFDQPSPSSLESGRAAHSKGRIVPLYEYVCKKCHHKFEKIQKFSDAKIKKCPECGGPVEQAVHAPAVRFKGTGWYVTDYAKKSDSKDSASKDSKDSASKKDEAPAAKEKTEDKGKKSSSKKND